MKKNIPLLLFTLVTLAHCSTGNNAPDEITTINPSQRPGDQLKGLWEINYVITSVSPDCTNHYGLWPNGRPDPIYTSIHIETDKRGCSLEYIDNELYDVGVEQCLADTDSVEADMTVEFTVNSALGRCHKSASESYVLELKNGTLSGTLSGDLTFDGNCSEIPDTSNAHGHCFFEAVAIGSLVE